jgi:hypothetical protein
MHPPTQKYVIIGFPQQQWFKERALTLHYMCRHCLYCCYWKWTLAVWPFLSHNCLTTTYHRFTRTNSLPVGLARTKLRNAVCSRTRWWFLAKQNFHWTKVLLSRSKAELAMAVTMQITQFWNVTQCRLAMHQPFWYSFAASIFWVSDKLSDFTTMHSRSVLVEM